MIEESLIAFAIIVIVLFVFYLLTRPRNYRNEVISKKYEEIRDELTVRKPKPIKVTRQSTDTGIASFTAFITGLVIMGVVLAVGVVVLSQVQQTLNTTTENGMTVGQVAGISQNSAGFFVFLPVIFAGIFLFHLMKSDT